MNGKVLRCVMVSAVLVLIPSVADASGECMIRWWGDQSGEISTAELSRTEAATSEAFLAIWGLAPKECAVEDGCKYSCSLTRYYPPTMCEGLPRIWLVSDSGEYSYEDLCDEEYVSGRWDVRCCMDRDGDGYGYPAETLCTYPAFDCKDDNPDVNPGTPEDCSNGIDDDCDNQVDGDDPDCAEDQCRCDMDQDGDCDGADLSLFTPDWGRDDCLE
jgi:hypothetical protein